MEGGGGIHKYPHPLELERGGLVYSWATWRYLRLIAEGVGVRLRPPYSVTPPKIEEKEEEHASHGRQAEREESAGCTPSRKSLCRLMV